MTVRQVLEAILKDKTPKLRHQYGPNGEWQQDGPHCAIGGAAFVMKRHSANRIARGLQGLRVAPEEVKAIDPKDHMRNGNYSPSLFSVITVLNDATNLSKVNIAKRLLRNLSEKTLDMRVPLSR